MRLFIRGNRFGSKPGGFRVEHDRWSLALKNRPLNDVQGPMVRIFWKRSIRVITQQFHSARRKTEFRGWRRRVNLTRARSFRLCFRPVPCGSCRGPRRRGGAGDGRGCVVRGQLDPELGALAPRRVEADLAPHELGEALGDGEADARPLDRSRLLPCALERLKKLVLLVGGDAEAGVADRDQGAPARRQ